MNYGRLILLLFTLFSVAIFATCLWAWVTGMDKLH